MRERLRGWYDAVRGRLDKQDKVLIKNSSWIFSSNLVVAVLAFLKSIIVARGLGAELFGNYVIMVALIVTINEFFNLNMSVTVIKYGADYRSDGRMDKLVALLKAGALVSVGLALTSTLVVVGVVGLAYDTFVSVEGYEFLLIALSFVSISSYFDGITNGMLRLYYRFKISAGVRVLVNVLDLAASAVVLLLFPHQLKPYFFAMIALKGVGSAVLNVSAWAELAEHVRPHLGTRLSVLRGEWRRIAAFSLSVSGSSTLSKVQSQGDKLILGALAGVQQVAFYEIAKKIAGSFLRLTDPLRLTIYPQLATLVAGRRFGEAGGLVRRVALLFGVPGLAVVVAGFFLSEGVVVSLYGQQYGGAAPVLAIFLAVIVLDLSLFWMGPLLNSLGMANRLLVINAASLVFFFLVAFAAVPRWGAAGMAVAMLLTKLGGSAVQVRISAAAMRRGTSEASREAALVGSEEAAATR